MEEKQELIIEWHADGFMDDDTFSFNIRGILKEYKDKFPGAEKLYVTFHERHYLELSRPSTKKTIEISSDKYSIIINLEKSKYYDIKGNVTGQPTYQSVFDSLKFVLDKAVEEYNATKLAD